MAQEIYRNSSDRDVYLNVPVTPVGNSIDIKVFYNGEVVYEAPTVTPAPGGGYYFTLPFSLVRYDRDLEVCWKFDYVEGTETYTFEDMTPVRVVTPLLTVDEIKQINEDLDDEAAIIVESEIRHIIEFLTGQSFGYYVGNKNVPGSGGRSLAMPMKLIEVTDVASEGYVFNSYAYQVVSDGWYLEHIHPSLLTIKEMPPEWSLDAGAVITTPYTSYYRGFRPNSVYTIGGRWGYAAVPANVKLAARLLVQEYACPEAAYRDKMLKSIKSGDWALGLSSVAWETTGHVRADQLIAPYVLFEGAIF